eukprot:189305_1
MGGVLQALTTPAYQAPEPTPPLQPKVVNDPSFVPFQVLSRLQKYIYWSNRCIFSYKSHDTWRLIAVSKAGQSRPGTTGYLTVEYDFQNDHWTQISPGAQHPMGGDYYNAILISDKEQIYTFGPNNMLMDGLGIFDLKTHSWSSHNGTSMFDIAQCASLQYITESKQVHGVEFHIDKKHKVFTLDEHHHNEPKIITNTIDAETDVTRDIPRLFYCKLLQKLYVVPVNGRIAEDPHPRFIYECDIFRHSDPGIYMWKKTDTTLPLEMRPLDIFAFLGLEHIIFCFYRRDDGFLGVYCFDVLIHKWWKSDKYFHDLSDKNSKPNYCFYGAVGVGDTNIHLFATRNHVRLSLLHLLPKRMFGFYSWLIMGFARTTHSTMLIMEIIELVARFIGCNKNFMIAHYR